MQNTQVLKIKIGRSGHCAFDAIHHDIARRTHSIKYVAVLTMMRIVQQT